MRRTLLSMTVVGLVTLGGVAQEPGGDERKPPKSGPAKQAILKRDRAVEKADTVYRKATADANKVMINELKKAKDAAINSKNLDEANAVAAVISQTEQELELADAKRRERSRLAVDPRKGVWEHTTGSRGTYRADGTVRFDAWGGNGSWKVVDARTITQRDSHGACTITFSTDGRYALWVYGPDDISYAKRSD